MLTALPLLALCLSFGGVLAAVAGGYMALAFVVAATAIVGAVRGSRRNVRSGLSAAMVTAIVVGIAVFLIGLG